MNMSYIPDLQKPPRWRPDLLFWIMFIITMIFLFAVIVNMAKCEEIIGYASWYSVESCLKESGQFIMANGEVLNDDKFTCASWQFPFGTILRITNVHTGRYCLARVTDRGPAKRLVRKGRIIDLSKRAFSELLVAGETLDKGLLKVKVERIR